MRKGIREDKDDIKIKNMEASYVSNKVTNVITSEAGKIKVRRRMLDLISNPIYHPSLRDSLKHLNHYVKEANRKGKEKGEEMQKYLERHLDPLYFEREFEDYKRPEQVYKFLF